MHVRVLFGEPFPLRLGPHHERVHGSANARLHAACACRVGTCMRSYATRPLEPLVTKACRRRMQQRLVGGCWTVQVHRHECTSSKNHSATDNGRYCADEGPLLSWYTARRSVCQLQPSTYQRRAHESWPSNERTSPGTAPEVSLSGLHRWRDYMPIWNVVRWPN